MPSPDPTVSASPVGTSRLPYFQLEHRSTPNFAVVALVPQATELRKWGAEGVIVGSALVKALGEAEDPTQGLDRFSALAKSIREAI